MTIQSAISGGLTTVATAVRSLRSIITGSNTGNLSGLTTIDKTSVLAAINELKAGQALGFKYTYSMASQPHLTWVQATTLTSVYDTTGSVLTLSSGTFTFKANTIANVVRNWLFYIDTTTSTFDGVPVAVEVRVGGTSIGRQVSGNVSGISLSPQAALTVPARIQGGEAVSFHFYQGYQPLLGLGSSTATMTGTIYGVAL